MKTYMGIEIRDVEDFGDDARLTPGRYYLILVSPERGEDHYQLRTEPGRTNMSHEPRLHGWLGTTNNVARYAEGCVEVYKNKAGHMRVRPCKDIVPTELHEGI
jgi:hypothetical protein